MKNKVLGLFKGKSLRAQLMRGGVGSILVKIIGIALSLLVAVLLARILGPEQYGIYAFAFSLITIIAVPVKLGLPQLVLRETAKAHATEQWGLMRGIWRWSTIAVCAFSVLAAVIALTILLLFTEGIANSQTTTIIIGLTLIPLIALANLRDSSIKGLKHVVLGQLIEGIVRPIFFIVIFLIVYYGLGDISPRYAMASQAFAALFAFVFGAALLLHVRPIQLKSNTNCEYKTKEWVGAALPLAMISGMQIINSQADIIMLGLFRTPEEVGIYKVVVVGSTLVAFGIQAVNMVVAPHFASLYAEGKIEKLQNLVTKSARATLALALPVVFILVAFGDELIGLIFGSEYSVGYSSLAILAIGQLISTLWGSVTLLLNMSGNEKYSAYGLLVGVFLNFILNLVLIPDFGILGAAIATVVSTFVFKLILHNVAVKKLQIETMAFGFKSMKFGK